VQQVNEILKPVEVAIFAVAKDPGITVGDGSFELGRLAEVDHPHAHTPGVVVDEQQRAPNQLVILV
jgi:hypothetical protein